MLKVASTLAGRRRTTSRRRGVRLPNSAARSGPTYRAAIAVAVRSNSAGSSDVRPRPGTWTKFPYGGSSRSTHRQDLLGSPASSGPRGVPLPVLKRWLSSSTIGTDGHDQRVPAGRPVAQLASAVALCKEVPDLEIVKGSHTGQLGPRGPRTPGQAPRGPGTKPRRTQSVGAAIGFTPARSSRLTLIVTTVMISASSAIPAETRYPWRSRPSARGRSIASAPRPRAATGAPSRASPPRPPRPPARAGCWPPRSRPPCRGSPARSTPPTCCPVFSRLKTPRPCRCWPPWSARPATAARRSAPCRTRSPAWARAARRRSGCAR